MMQRITYEETVKACREAYLNGTLLARAYELDKSLSTVCVYDDGHGHRCAIGSALNADTLREIVVEGRLNESSICSVDMIQYDPEDEDKLLVLQRAHDDWLSGRRTKDEFMSLIFPQGVPS